MTIILYTREACGYCDQSKKFLKERNIQFTEHKIGVNVTREEVLEKYPDARTLPLVIIDGEWIGGRDELMKRFYNDKTNYQTNQRTE